jgi:hypothetical protein
MQYTIWNESVTVTVLPQILHVLRPANRQEPILLCLNQYTYAIWNKKIYGLSPRANYTDRATAACQCSDSQLLRIEGATWSA